MAGVAVPVRLFAHSNGACVEPMSR
jgi:hypothetical protein